MQLLRSVRSENSRGECSSSKLHPHPCLPRGALTAARSAIVAETSAPTTAQHTAKPARNATSHFAAVCRQQSTSGTRHGQRRSRMSPQRENATNIFQSLCGVANAHPIDDIEIICNLRDFELEHCIHDPTHDTWEKKYSAPQPTLGLCATHYPCETRALGLQPSLRRPTKAALVSVVADTGCQLGLNVRQLSKTRLQMRAANGNNLDIIGAIALRLSESGMSIVSFIIKHTHFSGRNVMLKSVSDRIDGGARASVCGRSGRFCQVCAFFLGNPSVVQTWAGTDRVDVSVQLLVSLIIV